jgi:hypothetical protein
MTPDQRVTEVYSYSGDQGSVNRTTNQAADGTAETRTERSYTVDRPIEEMMGSDIPASPTNPHGTIQPLPEKDRSHTSVAQVEIVTSDANGNQTVQHSEETFSQSSRDVQAHGPITSEGAPPQTFPDGTIVPDPDNSITSGGEMTFGEEVVGQFDLGNRDLATELREEKSVTASELLAMASAVGQAGGGTMASGDGVVFKPKNPRGAPVSPGLERMGKAAEVLGLAYGVDSMFHGVLERDPRKILEGFGNVTGGVESMAGAAAALGGRSRLSSGAARLSTFLETKALGSALGKIGPGVSIGTGLWDAYHAETGWDRAAGLMTATSGALMMLGLPGKLAGGVLAIAAIGVGNGDATDTAAFDPRLY